MESLQAKAKNPRRQAAGRLNQLKSNGMTLAGRAKLRAAALLNRPWQWSTGPRTGPGKAKAADNGRVRQKGEVSARELRAEIAKACDLLRELQELRRSVEELREQR
jgi:hypothetical protein